MQKGKFAIVVAYVECQNCPSRPDETLLFVPDDPIERDPLLVAYFMRTFDGSEADDIVIKEAEAPWGDLEVTDADAGNDSHIFLTFIKNDIREIALS